jgi:hypothetical protein
MPSNLRSCHLLLGADEIDLQSTSEPPAPEKPLAWGRLGRARRFLTGMTGPSTPGPLVSEQWLLSSAAAPRLVFFGYQQRRW